MTPTSPGYTSPFMAVSVESEDRSGFLRPLDHRLLTRFSLLDFQFWTSTDNWKPITG